MAAPKKPRTISSIPKAKVRKGKFAGNTRKSLPGALQQPPPLTRYTVPKK